jgi:hypothetical protein
VQHAAVSGSTRGLSNAALTGQQDNFVEAVSSDAELSLALLYETKDAPWREEIRARMENVWLAAMIKLRDELRQKPQP